MDLIADLEHFPAADALQWASSCRFDGRLVFRRNRRSLSVSFDQGRIVNCEGNKPLESFGQHLFARGVIDGLDLATAQRQAKRGSLGASLVELGVLDRDQVIFEYSRHCQSLAASLMSWPDGIVAAHRSRLRPLPDPEPKALDPLFAILEGTRRLDEMDRIRQTLPHDNSTIRRSNSAAVSLAAPLARMLEVLAGEVTVGELSKQIGGCKFEFYVNANALVESGLLTVTAAGKPPAPTPRNTLTIIDVLLDGDLDRRRLA